ncbi:DivIVA domain-containing protein [Streptococcus ruminantium]|uniref:DivIVA domain-containing protein n=1 Tax=Streptococcus ruminantium TaxID=1917441 RepID=A0ABU1B3A0_9STRE|nr:DivIVA domain-containing protein [Streptococcus ruminantium]MDQ8759870.1 DivIVA domain-containing protein [Streptococcus ruminantium]MDQ8768952.1 DivIVA domain-containing protein [Streptococcus ruminantium]MDQ8774319.1 DivIVA domain-containing protein [Streptococcus ruminantium]MDQ8793229.1 DivIVA domain-containing protein [Streptococcus ruminantium]MDQ8796522.1 DivIVA domain-containing protein [Streptococcus ruminantium]
MALTALELKDKTFSTKFRGYDADEVDDFLDIVTRDYEDLIRKNHEQELELKNLRERLAYFDEMKESLSQSVLLAQDTAEKVKHAAEDQATNIIKQADYDAATLLHEARDRANEILRSATDNAKKVVIETEELKNNTRIFHQRLKSTIESQLSLVNSSEWEEILRPTASYIQTSDEAFRDVLRKALDEEVVVEEESLDYTRQLTPEEIAELTRQAATLEMDGTVEFPTEE